MAAAPDGESAHAHSGERDRADTSAAPAASGFSLTFAKSGSSKQPHARKQQPAAGEQADRELITGFVEGHSEAADRTRPIQRGQLVIPKQENTFKFQASRGPRGYNPDRWVVCARPVAFWGPLASSSVGAYCWKWM